MRYIPRLQPARPALIECFNEKSFMEKTLLRPIVMAVLASFTLYGCSAANHRPNFERLEPSADTFSITVDVPAGYHIEADTAYRPRSWSCPAFLGDTGVVVGLQPKGVISRPDSAAVSYSFEIPLRIVNSGCPLFPQRPTLTLVGPGGKSDKAKEEIIIFFPDDIWGRFWGHGPLTSLQQYRRCSYVFDTPSGRGGVSKTISCNTYDAERKRIVRETPRFAWSELQGKNIHFTFELEPEDNPRDPREWVKTPEGYRACAKQGSDFFCTEPPRFRQFKMDGQLCDVYPACTLTES
ncbi:hypothetical protein [Halopseudomonas pertucinogena]|uniref:hypothetical protein n=1 Tax=Halopseudomonas pertucinogena TaxID=86175 RepID=UPI00166C67D7|nr:hypothetical protein [Halopseudomonas pertucinogena]